MNEYVVDTARTRIGFVARHTVGPKVRGHFGEFEGRIRVDVDAPSASTVSLTIRADSVRTRNPLRDRLVRSGFLKQGDHPDITFRSTAARQTGGTTFEITGELGVRGVTRPVTVPLQRVGDEQGIRTDDPIRFTGHTVIDRKDWGVHWIAAAGMVARDVALEFDVVIVPSA